MKVTNNHSQEEHPQTELYNFIADGLQDVYDNHLLDFDSTFNELEEK